MGGMTAPLLPARHANRVTRVDRSARLHAMFAQCNQAIIRSADEQTMFNRVCGALVAEGLFQWACIARQAASADHVALVANAGSAVAAPPPELLTAAFETRTAQWAGKKTPVGMLPLGAQAGQPMALCVGGNTHRALDTVVRAGLLELATNLGFALGTLASQRTPPRAAAQANQAQRLTQAFMDNLPGTVFLKDSHLRLLMVNRHLAQSPGVPADDLIGRNNEQLFPPDFAQAANQLDRSVLATGQSQNVAQVFRDRHVDTRLFVVDDGEGHRLLGGISLDATNRFHEHQRTQALLALQELATQLDERSLLTQGLESAEQLTNSQIGFLHFVNDDQETLELVTWTSGALRGCTAAHDSHYPISSAGIWADCFRNRSPMVVNDYAAHTVKKGLPDGHAHLERFVSVPVIEGERVCMMLGVGNKSSDYSQTDVETLQLLGNDLWRIARRRRVEQSLQQRLQELQVAHEINNPIGFLRSNPGTLSGYVDGLIQVVRAYEAAESSLSRTAPGAFDAVRTLKQQTDHDFVVGELPVLIAESQDGIERVRKIVLDLKNFSRAGDTDWQWADLALGLESTINMVWNQIEYKAELRREYQPLPQVYCIASQINQVIMNLLVNAVQAIEQSGVITVRSGADATQAWIEVEDTGCGMTDDQMHHIFEPFFTTKPPGQGTRICLNLPIDHRQGPNAPLPAQDAPP